MAMAAIHLIFFLLAVFLFFSVNWIGKHATSFGYASTTLFESANEYLALNLFIRTLPPAVMMVLFSAIVVASGRNEMRLDCYFIAIYYYVIRAAYFPLFNLHRLVNWRRFMLNVVIGAVTAWAVYKFLILPKKSLLPDLEAAGNELWLAIFLFIYATANNISLADTKGARRRNLFLENRYKEVKKRYETIIDDNLSDDRLKLVAYAIVVYEDYCRPPLMRMAERLAFWKSRRTTGIMQVSSDRSLSDVESVRLGTEILVTAWQAHESDQPHLRIQSVISNYNRDDDYLANVSEIMRVIAKRIDPSFNPAYNSIYNSYYPIAERRDRRRNRHVRQVKRALNELHQKVRALRSKKLKQRKS